MRIQRVFLLICLAIGAVGVWQFFKEQFPLAVTMMVAGFGGAAWFRARLREAEAESAASNGPMISLVLLLSQPRYLEAAVLAEILASAWGEPVRAGGEEDRNTPVGGPETMVFGRSPMFMVSSAAGMFVVHNHAQPYVHDADSTAAQVPELRARRVIAEHQAWLSVDCMTQFGGSDLESTYRRIAKAIAELADDTVLGLFQPDGGRLLAWEPAIEERLRQGDTLEEIFGTPPVPVVQISDEDPRMKAAVAEARARWPEFAAAFEARPADTKFAVKAAVTRGERTEFIWLEVVGLEPEYIHGTLANDPVDLGGLKLGDQIEVPLADLNDWAITRDGEPPVGLFTVKVLADEFQEQKERVKLKAAS